jgi:predicted aspartyl protease
MLNIRPYEKRHLSEVQFKVDSGADLSTISKIHLIRIGYSYEWIEAHMIADLTHTLSRAGGTAEPAYYIKFDVINLLDKEFVNWPLYIRKERNVDFPNLLGINMLTYFNFQFDYEKWIFGIKSISQPKTKLPMLHNQSVHEVKHI